MGTPEHSLLNSHLAMGIFAFYVVIVSLVRIMADKEFFRVAAMKRIWGRTRGLAMHFISNVAVPLVCGIMFLTSGITGFGLREESDFRDPVIRSYVLRHAAATEVASGGDAPMRPGESLLPHKAEEFDPGAWFRLAP